MSVLHVWVQFEGEGGGGNLILLFCTCSQIASLNQARIVPLVNGKGILREIVVGNNKPTCHEAQSIFKVLRFKRMTAQKSITSCIFGHPTVIHSQGAIFDCCSSWLKALIDDRADAVARPLQCVHL